jgi:hypothetical protein
MKHQFESKNTHGGKKKGMAEYRASLTREAYEHDPDKCRRVIRNIIDGAEKLEPVCVKVFAQSYMTKAPSETEININHNNTKEILKENEFSKEEAYTFEEELNKRMNDIIKDILKGIIQNRSSGSPMVEPNE